VSAMPRNGLVMRCHYSLPTDGDAGVHTFFVARADGWEIGCLGQHGLGNSRRVVLKVSAFEECVT
jgi:hypothetical protein